jgi:hypothetical protein
MKMEMKSLEIKSKWYEGIGKVQGLPSMLSNLQMVKYLPKTQEKQAYIAI